MIGTQGMATNLAVGAAALCPAAVRLTPGMPGQHLQAAWVVMTMGSRDQICMRIYTSCAARRKRARRAGKDTLPRRDQAEGRGGYWAEKAVAQQCSAGPQNEGA